MTKTKNAENDEPTMFIIYRPCGILTFDPVEIERRYCGGCKKTHPDERDWFLYERSMGEQAMVEVFRAYLTARDADKAGVLKTLKAKPRIDS